MDCANDYDNEHVIGEALQELYAEKIVKRSDLFIQAKLWNSNHRPEHVEADLDATLKVIRKFGKSGQNPENPIKSGQVWSNPVKSG